MKASANRIAREGFFFKINAENKARRLVPDFFLFFKKALYEVKASGLQIQYILTILNLACNKNKLYKTINLRSRDMCNFDLLEKSVRIVSPPRFLHDFLRKMFLMLYSIN